MVYDELLSQNQGVYLHMKPNRVVCLTVLAAASVLLSRCGAAQDPLHKTGAVGCYHAAFAGINHTQFGCGILTSFGNQQVDQFYDVEFRRIAQFFEQNVPLYVFDECSPDQANAYAVPQPVGTSCMVTIWQTA